MVYSSGDFPDPSGESRPLHKSDVQYRNSSNPIGSIGRRRRHKAGAMKLGLLVFGVCGFGMVTIKLHKWAMEDTNEHHFLKAKYDHRTRSPISTTEIHDAPAPSLTGTKTYSMILPLVCKEAASAQLLLSTIYAFTDPDELEAIFIVVDAKDLSCVHRRLHEATAHLSKKCSEIRTASEGGGNNNTTKNSGDCWVRDKIKYLTSESLIPELSGVPRMAQDKGGRYFIPESIAQTPMLQARSFGYIIQMLVKLAIAEHIQTDYYITLDADILCTRKMKYDKIIVLEEGEEKSDVSDNQNPDGVSFLSYDSTNARSENIQLSRRRAINSQDIISNHLNWWEATDGLLKLGGVVSDHEPSYMAMGVTPAIMHRNTVLQLQRYIEKLYKQPWRYFLIQACTTTMWTEYTLYHSYAVASGAFLKHHLPINQDSNHFPRLYPRKNIWNPPTQLEDWDWAHSFDQTAEKEGFFLVTQASLFGVNVTIMESIATKIRSYLPDGTLPSTLEIRAFVDGTDEPAKSR